MAGKGKEPYVKLEAIVTDSGTKYFVQASGVPRLEVEKMSFDVIISYLETGFSLREALRKVSA